MTPQTGRMVKENGETVNLADLIGGTDTGEKVNLDMMAPKSGRFVKEDGSVVNLADVIEAFLSGGGSAAGQPLQITIGETTYTYTGAEPVTLEIPAAAELQALSIKAGGKTYSYDGKSPVSIEIPDATPAANKALNINLGGQSYSYDGSAQVDISIPAAEGVQF